MDALQVSAPSTSYFEWTKALTLKLIELYRDRPCLYQIKSDLYKNRIEKTKAYADILHHIQIVNPVCSLEILKKKLNTLRSQYRKELKLMNTSRKSGAGTHEVYVPKLWCFYELRFLDDGELQRESTSNLDPLQVSLCLSIHVDYCIYS